MRWGFLLVLLAGCGSGDTSDTGLASLSCEELRERFAAELAGLDRSCDSADDCAVVGSDLDTCNCAPHLSTACGGDPVQRAAYQAVRDIVDPIAAEFDARCLDCNLTTCTCDCEPFPLAGCGAGGTCTATPVGSCFPEVDAGP